MFEDSLNILFRSLSSGKLTRPIGFLLFGAFLYLLAQEIIEYRIFLLGTANSERVLTFTDHFLPERLDRYALVISLLFVSVLLIASPEKVNRTFIQPLPVESSGYDIEAREIGSRNSLLGQIERLSKKLQESDERNSARFREITKQIESSRKNEISLTSDEREELLLDLRSNLSHNLLPDSIQALAEHHHRSIADELRQKSLARLGNQVEILGARANRALAYGILFAFLGLATLYATFFIISPTSSDIYTLDLVPHPWLRFVENYLPRLALVLIIEVVAFFFLRLHSKMLSEIRYVQNEMTNVELKLIALARAATISEDDSLREVISTLSTTERNSIIEKSQTTVDIERERASSEADANSIRAMAELLHGNDKGWFWKKRE